MLMNMQEGIGQILSNLTTYCSFNDLLKEFDKVMQNLDKVGEFRTRYISQDLLGRDVTPQQRLEDQAPSKTLQGTQLQLLRELA